MSAPNRSQQVKQIAALYPQTFVGPADELDARRRLLIPIIARELNKVDGEKWFLLNRMDRNDDDPKPGRLTSDVIVWGPTKEHVDVLSSSGGMWKEHAPITDKDWLIEPWQKWPTWESPNVPPAPPTPPTPPQPPIDVVVLLNARITQLEKEASVHADAIVNMGAQILELQERKPPAFELPELIAEGSTNRIFAHAHSITLQVKPKPKA